MGGVCTIVPMTKKQKLQTTLPDGSIAERTTARTYTHLIAVGRTVETQIQNIQDDIDRQERYLAEFRDEEAMEAHYQEMAAHFPETFTVEGGRQETVEQIARVEAYIAEYEAKKAEVLARNETEWTAWTWCGRPDLAQKAHADAVKKGFGDFVEIVEVSQ